MARFSGIITPIVTPFNRDETQTINFDAAAQLIDKLIDAGVSGIFPLGSNGEFHVLTHEEKLAFAKFVIQHVNHRVPVYIGTGACSTKETIELSQEAEALGADALSVINPYFIQPTDTELIEHYKAVAASVKLPIMLYNIPKSTGRNISKEVLAALAPIDNISGIKDSSGNMENLQDYLDAGTEHGVEVIVGSDSKIAQAVSMGATAAIAGTSNLITDTVVSLFNAAQAGEKTDDLQAALEPLRNVLHRGTVPSMLKRSVELAGIPVGPARRPASEPTAEDDAAVRAMLDEYGIAHS